MCMAESHPQPRPFSTQTPNFVRLHSHKGLRGYSVLKSYMNQLLAMRRSSSTDDLMACIAAYMTEHFKFITMIAHSLHNIMHAFV